MIRLKRAYAPAADTDGARFLVERLWPRGVTKDALGIEAWVKDASPSPGLRAWYAHDPEKWPEFRERYTAELEANPEGWRPLLERARAGTITLVYAAKDTERNSASVLKGVLERHLNDDDQ
jgi:uncharacterized protein YeaO (DUF488 family)